MLGLSVGLLVGTHCKKYQEQGNGRVDQTLSLVLWQKHCIGLEDSRLGEQDTESSLSSSSLA